MTLDVVICGSAMTRFGRGDGATSPRDWMRQVCLDACLDAGIAPDAIDAVVIASESDHMSLQLSSGALMNDELGLVPRPVMRVEAGGASGAMAVRAGLMQLMSGMAKCVLVAGFEHAASHLRGDDVRLLYGLSFDADMEGFAGANAAALYALSVGPFMARCGLGEMHLATVAVKNHGNACLNPNAHKPMRLTVSDALGSELVAPPYRRLDCSPLSDGAAALVLMRRHCAPGDARARAIISASGCASDHVRLGDRKDFSTFAGKAMAARSAYAMAGVSNPRNEIGFAEVYDAFSGAELQALAALGLSGESDLIGDLAAGCFERDGRQPINLSGGLIGQGGVPGAVGIAQIHTLARLLEGRYYPPLQPVHAARWALADCHGGVATVNVVHILASPAD